MNNDILSLSTGVKVDIKRSDGRIHSALITAVNAESDSVTVEWFENGETKGKEIDATQMFALNPDLKRPPPPKQPSQPVSRPSHAVRSHKDPASKKQGSNLPPPSSSRIPKGGRAKSHIPSRAAEPASNDTAAYSDENTPPEKIEKIDESDLSSKNNDKQTANRRRSNCVKEVERLKKNREERRARQQQVKVKREQAQLELDPGNPNWEFLQMIRDYQSDLYMEHMTLQDPIKDHQICVCVRKRPLNKKEIGKKDFDVITIPDKESTVVHECKLKVDLTKYLENQKFRFDYTFDDGSTNELVYRYTAKPLVEAIFNGGMSTCFAYGQTGSGKTHTMGGDFVGKQQDCTKGIYALAAGDVFRLLKSNKYKSEGLSVSTSFFEIYGGKVFDLLNARKKLRVLEDGQGQVQVVDLEERPVNSAVDVLNLIECGVKARTSGQTSANQYSSRSHAILQIVLRKRRSLFGKFSLIDLAGNERGADTSTSTRQTRMEGAEINKSLLALKECIRALGRKGSHLPFRASKLTQVLRDSFIGENTKTCMIAMISPGLSCTENTLNTLRYADRVKELGPDNGPSKKNDIIQVREDLYSPEKDKYGNSELAMLCTSENNAEQSADLYTFHEAISSLMDTEDQLAEEHRTCVQENKELLNEEENLLNKIDLDVDFDFEEYVKRLEEILSMKITKFNNLLAKVNRFKEQVSEEERASRNIRRLPML